MVMYTCMVCIVGSVDHRQLAPDLRTMMVNGQMSRHAAVLPSRAMRLPSMYSSSLDKILCFRPTTGSEGIMFGGHLAIVCPVSVVFRPLTPVSHDAISRYSM